MLALVLLAVFATATEECEDVGSKMLCENCKCFGASKHTHVNITSRQACAEAAFKEGMKYYSWLRYGKELLCSFGTHKEKNAKGVEKVIGTEEQTCIAAQDKNTQRPWRIYQLDDNKDNCRCETVEAVLKHAGYKCDGFSRIRKWVPDRRRTAKSAEHCGLMAYQAGHAYFSFLNSGVPDAGELDTRWCIFGHKVSSVDSCETKKFDAKNDKWGIYTTACNEKHFAYKHATCNNRASVGNYLTVGTTNAIPDSTSKSETYTACCSADKTVADDKRCTVTVPGNILSCLGDGEEVDYYTARATCESHNMRLCEDWEELVYCCQNPTCGFNSKFFWTSKLSNGLDLSQLQ